MARPVFTFATCTLALLASAVGAQAGQQCYRHVSHAAVHHIVTEEVVVTPAHTIAHKIPAQHAVVQNAVVKKQVMVPAVHATRHRNVMVQPARVGWEPLHGHYHGQHHTGT